ncbi:hypothetical protein J6590_023041 [Homalodisca vitripennis]|nr:hypothetical protein J6590_023041 [Homalodisca vitripennis]
MTTLTLTEVEVAVTTHPTRQDPAMTTITLTEVGGRSDNTPYQTVHPLSPFHISKSLFVPHSNTGIQP